jgi:hypothetical protein
LIRPFKNKKVKKMHCSSSDVHVFPFSKGLWVLENTLRNIFFAALAPAFGV